MEDILKKRSLKLIGWLFIVCLTISCTSQLNQKGEILLITGGHDFDTTEFFNLFDSLTEYRVDTLSQPAANHFIGSGKALNYDVLVFYDSWQEISDEEKKAYLGLTDKGISFLFLHHSLVSYQDWEEFSKIRGGRYYKSELSDSIKDSRYKHDLDLSVEIQDSTHPITKGMRNFVIHDEGYSNIIFNVGVSPLLKTDDPDCAEMFAWTTKYRNSKIVYLMGGHDKMAFRNENYKELIRGALNYLGE